jgi:hypothetical protein
VGNESKWKAERQPAWMIKAIKKQSPVELVDYGDINQRLLEAIGQITRYSQQVRAAIEDGVVEPHEREVIDEERHRAITKLQEHTTLVDRFFCSSEK